MANLSAHVIANYSNKNFIRRYKKRPGISSSPVPHTLYKAIDIQHLSSVDPEVQEWVYQ